LDLFINDPYFLGERYYVSFALWHEPSVCRLSVVCRLPGVCDVGAPFSEGWTFCQHFCTT